MNELLAKAGAFFVAPAAPAARTAPRAPQLAGVLAGSRDLDAAAGAVAAALKAECSAHAAVVCRNGALTPPKPATLSASALARRLQERDISAIAAGALCHVSLDAEHPARDFWRVAAAAEAPVVVAAEARAEDADQLFAQLDLLVLTPPEGCDALIVDLAQESLARLGPPTVVHRVVAGPIARRIAALGWAAAKLVLPAEAPA